MTNGPVPMFPLGSVLFPHGVLPLRVFEPRYQALLDTCLGGDGRFGVVLIERGFEVGGGDERFDVGTLAQIVRVVSPPGGDRLVLAVGVGRFRVGRWLTDDPFPRAEIVELSDPAPPAGSGERARTIESVLRTLLALRSEAGHDVGSADFSLSEDPQVAGYQLCVLSPLSVLDRQALLEINDPAERLDRLEQLLEEEIDLTRRQLAGW